MEKRGAIELSVGTIIIIVLAMAMLILGMVLVRSIMCAGIQMTEQVSVGVQNEIKGLFGSTEYGVKCMGEGGQEAKLGDGGRRQIVCIINIDEAAKYSLKVNSITSSKGTPSKEVAKWVLDKDWQGDVSPGTKTVTVVLLDVPKKVSDTALEVEIEEENLDTGVKETHTSYIDVVHVGTITAAVC